MSYSIDNFVPAQENTASTPSVDNSPIRRPSYSLDNFTPSESIPDMLGRNAQQAAVGTLQEAGKIANVIRWPFDRFIWYPLGKAGEYAQGGDVSGEQKPIPPSSQEFMNEPLAPLSRIWNNYYKASMGNNADAPNWYKQLAVGGSIMGIEPGILTGLEKGAETLATRVATPEETATINSAFKPLKDSLSKVGIKPEDLHPEGNIIPLAQDSELYINKNISAVLRGDEVRIPRWMKINTTDALPPPDTLPLNHLDNLPVTTESIVPTSPKIGPDLTSESGQVTIPPVAEFIEKSLETLPTTNDMQKGFTQLKTQSAADDVRAKQLLKKINLDPLDAEALYHHQENPQEPLTDEQQKLYDETIKPLADKSSELFSKLRNEGLPMSMENYAPRFVEGKGNVFDRIKSDVQSSGGVSGLFKKTSGSFKTRTMKALIDEEGNRQVVSIKKGNVTAFTNKEATSLGKINSQENEDLLAKETAPLEAHIKSLENEEKILMATKSRTEASIIRLQNIQNDLMQTQLQIMNKNWEYNPDNLEKKVFVDKNGKRWSVGESTTREIEQHTDLTYHKNALLNNLVHYNELRKIDRATQYLESIKSNPEFQKYSMKAGTGNPPADWKMTSLPQFRGYYLEPRIADTLDHFNKQLYKGKDPLAVFTALNRFLRASIFFNPLIHIPNIATHWVTARGISGINPATWGRLASTSGRAIQAVIHQNKDYLDMLDSGVNLMAHNQGDTLQSMMLDKMGQELRGNSVLLKKIQGALGAINPYNISGKITWIANDVATLQAIFEEMEKGKTKFEAIDEVSKHIPNYVVPARVLNSKLLGEVMTNPNITMFGAYHYGALKSYGEMAKSLLGKVPLKERAEALDKLAMLGLLLFGFYPLVDEILKNTTGNKQAHIRRAGSTTLPDNIIKLAKGQIDFSQALQSVLTPAVGAKEGIELAFNKNLFTGDKIVHGKMELQGLKDLAVESIAPLNAITKITDKKISLNDYLLSMAGISMSDPNKGKLINMSDSKKFYQKEFDKEYADNPKKALANAQKFNDKQIKDLADIVNEEKMQEIPKSIVNRFIINTVGEPKQPASSAEDMLQKNKFKSRKRISS